MSETKRKYDSTVARIAGNILSGRYVSNDGRLTDHDRYAIQWAVAMARAIVAEVERTEPEAGR